MFFFPEAMFNILQHSSTNREVTAVPGELLWRCFFQTLASHGVQSAGLHDAVWDDGDT